MSWVNLVRDICLSVMWCAGAASFLMWDDAAEGQKEHYTLEFAEHKKDVNGFGTSEAIS